MSEKMGMVEYGEHEDYVFLGRDINRSRDYSEATAQEIDSEVRRLSDTAYERARELILKHRDKLELIAKALLEYETLDGPQIREIIDTGGMSKPPTTGIGSKPKAPPIPQEDGVTISPDYPPGLSGAPA